MSELLKIVRNSLIFSPNIFWQVEKLYGFAKKFLATLGDALLSQLRKSVSEKKKLEIFLDPLFVLSLTNL